MSEEVRCPVRGWTRTRRVRLTFGLLAITEVVVLHDMAAAVGIIILGYLVETER